MSVEVKRLKGTVAYCGSSYQGWARQKGVASIQGVLEEALRRVTKRQVKIHGSGRTDAGVHANGQVFHFDPPDRVQMSQESWVRALNSRLPKSVRVMRVSEVDEGFHARFSATSKQYYYSLTTTAILPPRLVPYTWHVPKQMDLILLQEVLSYYQGEHDFRNFSALRGNESELTSYRRTLTHTSLRHVAGGVELRYEGNGFLYKMVRLMTGIAVNAAQGTMPMKQIERMMQDPSGGYHRWKHCAPAEGLTLEKVFYES